MIINYNSDDKEDKHITGTVTKENKRNHSFKRKEGNDNKIK
jgi:hypothetical protein